MALRFFISFLILIPLFAFALDRAEPDSGKNSGTEQAPTSELAGGWRFVRTHNPNGGPRPFLSCTPPIRRGPILISQAS